MNHTTGAQDTTLNHAESSAQNTLDYVKDLIDMVAMLDGKIDEWITASGCDRPCDLEDKLAAQETRIEALEERLSRAEARDD